MRVLCLILSVAFFAATSSIAQKTNSSQPSTPETTDNEIEAAEADALPKPIFDLIASGDAEKVKEMLKDSVDYYAHDKNGETALTLAIKNDDTEMVKVLVRDAVINMKNEDGETPLTLAIKKGNPEIIKLICRRAKGSLKNDMGEAPLYLAVERQDLFLVEELIQKGANVNRRSNGITPLSHAAELNNFKAVGYLLKEGATANLPNDNGDIPLFIAIDRGYDITAGILINKSDDPMNDVNWRTKIDETLLNIAIVKSHPEIVKILLNAGANYEELDYFENSALHIAAREGNHEIIDILTKFGVEVNSRNLKGETPIMMAAKADQKHTVKFLIDRGANPDLKDYQGYCVRTAFDLSPETGSAQPTENHSQLTNYKQTKDAGNAAMTSSVYTNNN